MSDKKIKVGYAMCGSFCTLARSLRVMSALKDSGNDIYPIVSEAVRSTDTRFGTAEYFKGEIERISTRSPICTIPDAEPLGPKQPLDILVIAPCTGNTLAKIANGITDTSVTMAAKAHLRSDRPLLIALASNDCLSQNLANIGRLLVRKSVFFTPLLQDDPQKKPHSLVADFERIPQNIEQALLQIQEKPLFL